MKRGLRILITGIAFASLLGGNSCAVIGDGSPVDKNWGRSYESARKGQKLNPGPQASTGPVTGVEGEIAMPARYRYGSNRDIYNLNQWNWGNYFGSGAKK